MHEGTRGKPGPDWRQRGAAGPGLDRDPLTAERRVFKAVVVHSRVGGGHLSAARALAAALEATGHCTARLFDAYLDCGRFPVTAFPAAYAELARNHPRLWSLLYHGTSHPLNPTPVMRPFLRHGFAELMRQERPDVVVCTLPVVNGLLAHAADATGARLEVVLTDWHSVHPFWVSRGVDHYTAPTDSARGDCIRFGARPDAVDVVGIPVRTQFATASSAPPADLAAFGLQPGRPTVLAMVGAEGSPRALRNVAALAASDLDAQLLVVCGNSHGLRRQVEQLPARMPLSAVGFVENIAALMRACDVLVTKAGGLTLAEAFCCGIPVVIHDLLPGQEAGNLEYVLGRGAAEYAPAPTALVATLARLIGDRARREALSRCGAELARPRAAADIAANVLARLAP